MDTRLRQTDVTVKAGDQPSYKTFRQTSRQQSSSREKAIRTTEKKWDSQLWTKTNLKTGTTSEDSLKPFPSLAWNCGVRTVPVTIYMRMARCRLQKDDFWCFHRIITRENKPQLVPLTTVHTSISALHINEPFIKSLRRTNSHAWHRRFFRPFPEFPAQSPLCNRRQRFLPTRRGAHQGADTRRTVGKKPGVEATTRYTRARQTKADVRRRKQLPRPRWRKIKAGHCFVAMNIGGATDTLSQIGKSSRLGNSGWALPNVQ